MRTSCLINNYNYSQFVVEAIESALAQSVAFDEIIVVDDASTDGSQALLREHYSQHNQVKLVLKETNQGQLSAFNEGFLASTGDVLFFLDSDDLYHQDYLAEALQFYKQNKDCNFLFCHYELFGNQDLNQVPPPANSDWDYGFSVLSSLYGGRWIGGPTSVVSAKRTILSNFLPLPYLDDWRTRADDCLIYGASVGGARKFYLHKILVKYRIHGSNNLQSNASLQDTHVIYKRALALDRLFHFLKHKNGYSDDVIGLVDQEFQTIIQPTKEDLNLYIKIILLSNLAIHQKLKRILTIFKRFKQ